MKPSSFQFSLGASVVFHAVVFGSLAAIGFGARDGGELRDSETPITLTLIAAPDEPVNELARAVAVAPVVPVLQTVVALKPREPVAPIAPVEPVKEVIAEETLPVPTPVAISQPTPVAATPPPTLAVNSTPSPGARGDGSSATPGLDATTAHAQPGLLAKPNYLKNPEPLYPPAARRRRQEGLVLLSVKVNPHGRAVQVAVKQSSGFPLLDDAAMQAVGDWDFQPARIGTLAVESEIEVPVRFKLTQ